MLCMHQLCAQCVSFNDEGAMGSANLSGYVIQVWIRIDGEQCFASERE